MKRSGIYQIRNLINNKIYIGSAISLFKRRDRHFVDLRRNKHPNIKLQRFFNKQGENNFIFEILEEVPDNTKLIEREQFYLDTLKPEFNICKIAGSTLGTNRSKESIEKGIETKKMNGTNVCSEEIKINIGKGNKGKIVTEEVKEKISISLKKYFETNDSNFINKNHLKSSKNKISKSLEKYYEENESKNKNRKHSLEHRTKNSESKKLYYQNNTHPNKGNKTKEYTLEKIRKPILQIHKETNEVIKEWNSIKEATEFFKGLSIKPCLSKRTNSAYGFKWEYKN